MEFRTTFHCKSRSLMGFSSLDHGWDDSAAHPVGSSNMLLGGFGFLGRLHGLSIDNLVEVEMVLADGRIVVVNEDSYPGKLGLPLFRQVQVSPFTDLLWAVRGAGTTLGVATRYKAKAFPVPVVFAGNLI